MVHWGSGSPPGSQPDGAGSTPAWTTGQTPGWPPGRGRAVNGGDSYSPNGQCSRTVRRRRGEHLDLWRNGSAARLHRVGWGFESLRVHGGCLRKPLLRSGRMRPARATRVAPLLGPERPVVVVGDPRSRSPWRSGERTWFRTRGSQVRVLPGTRTTNVTRTAALRNAFVAQWKARLTTNQEVGGSSPSKGTSTTRYCEDCFAPLAEMAIAPGFYPGDGGSSPSRRTCPAGHRVAEMRRPPGTGT